MFSILFAVVAALDRPASPVPPPPAAPAFAWTVGVGRRTGHYQYHFDNPTTFDSPTPVPHFFEQRYDSGNTWLIVGVRYRLFGARARTEAGFTPRIQTAGSDIDTFFLPSGDVATSGTDGMVSLRSFAVAERLTLATWRRLDLGIVLEYQHSRADFPPDVRIVTHTQPPSETREFTTDRETTISHVFGSGVTADIAAVEHGPWRLAIGADFLPTVRAWLVTRLPDKYPGQDIVAEALNFGARGRVAIERRWSHVAAGAWAEANGVWRYRRAAHYSERGATVGVFVRTGR